MTRGRGPAPHVAPGAERSAAPTLSLDEAGSTPILREYRAVKAAYADAIVLARLGDFFELFGDDAVVAAPILGVALTGRGFGGAGRLPMCGVPAHAASGYVGRLLAAGRRVVLWDQVDEGVAGPPTAADGETGGEDAGGEAEAGRRVASGQAAGDGAEAGREGVSAEAAGTPAAAVRSPSTGRALVRREVTRVLSPGLVVDEAYLESGRAVRCVALAAGVPGRVGLAALDAAGGELQLAEVRGELESDTLADELDSLGVAEILLADGTQAPGRLVRRRTVTSVPAAWFSAARGVERLLAASGAASLRGFSVEDLGAAHAAAAALLGYAERSRLSLAPGFLRVRRRDGAATMRLDAPTRRNLEVVAGVGGSGGLLGICDRTRTPMGARRLRAVLLEPLVETAPIVARLDAVAGLRADRAARATLRQRLGPVRDLERLVGRCVQRLASPRDLAAVAAACAALPEVAMAAAGIAAGSALLVEAVAACAAPDGLGERIAATLVDEPPATLRDGGAVREGADSELDRLRAAGSGARDFIASLEERERASTQIRSLKVGYNRVFGYYLEVPNAQRELVPAEYQRRQTLVGAERYVTPLLAEQEAVVLGARERSLAREAEVVTALVAAVADVAGGLLAAAGAVATLDVAQALAETADELGWCRPEVDGSTRLEIVAGRHPLVEAAVGAGAMVANDCALGGRDLGGGVGGVEAGAGENRGAGDGARGVQSEGDEVDAGTGRNSGSGDDARGADTGGKGSDAAQVLVVTGPNMAGKSTYLRTVAVCVLLAQVGSFVPATRARIGVCDRIFTRVGAHDDLAAGLSTFMVEMTETAAILNAASPRSLVVLDEIGRGTSTYDGLSIAEAVVEHLCDAPRLGCRTLFATHYHELTAMAARRPGVRNARVEVVEEGETVTFLHRIVEGGADRSFGIHVARLAGIPGLVVGRARQLLAERESARPLAARSSQLELPMPVETTHPVVAELGALEVDGLTPLEALNKLAEWRARVGGTG